MAQQYKKTDPLLAMDFCRLTMEQDDERKKTFSKKAKKLLSQLEQQLNQEEKNEK